MPQFLEMLSSTSPRRSLTWSATDSQGNPLLDANGQPVDEVLYPQIVVQERGTDELELTQHPIEHGAAITDHAFKLPAQVQVKGSWSFAAANAGAIAAGTPTTAIPPTDPSYLQRLYAVLLQLQILRTFVTLVTGKRTYTYMLMKTLEVITDEATENVLEFTAIFQEVLMAQTQTVTVPSASVMANPSINAATTDQGNTSLQPGTNANVNALPPALPPITSTSLVD